MMPEFLREFITPQLFVSINVMMIVVHVILIAVAYCIYLERKISAYIQDRLGPNRVGFDFGLPWLRRFFTDTPGLNRVGLHRAWGLGQPLADGIKFLLKEDYRPTRADVVLFTLAPIVIIVPALIGFIVIPWGGLWEFSFESLPGLGDIGQGVVHVTGANVNVGVIYLTAVASLGVYGVTLGGWASNSKYSFLGGLRSTAQMISYEIPLGLSLLAAVLLTASFLPTDIIKYQVVHGPLALSQPIAAVMFFICILAEANRAPFDNAEAEQELVGGYHTEYSSMRFALFFLAEYAHMITSSAFFVLLFFGGYHLHDFGTGIFQWTHPDFYESGWLGLAVAAGKFGVFFGKVMLSVCFMIVIRWTLPRLRYDQVMMLGWQSLIPISLTVLVTTSVMVYLGLTSAWAMFGVNLVLIVGIVLVQGMFPRSTRNRKVPMYGSRFSPVPGTAVRTAPSDPMALEDRPVQGTVSTS